MCDSQIDLLLGTQSSTMGGPLDLRKGLILDYKGRVLTQRKKNALRLQEKEVHANANSRAHGEGQVGGRAGSGVGRVSCPSLWSKDGRLGEDILHISHVHTHHHIITSSQHVYVCVN